MKLLTEPYLAQLNRWPSSGRHILAQFDSESIVIYQAYSAQIGVFAAQQGYFGRGFSFDRMSWLKPNFLWMMYRSGWGTKPGQEITLAIHLQRRAFDTILAAAVPSSFARNVYASQADWQKAVRQSQVRLQWDPDRYPCPEKVERRAIQLGLCGEILCQYAREWIIEIEDISEFVRQQYIFVRDRDLSHFVTPSEKVYRVCDPEAIRRLELSQSE